MADDLAPQEIQRRARALEAWLVTMRIPPSAFGREPNARARAASFESAVRSTVTAAILDSANPQANPAAASRTMGELADFVTSLTPVFDRARAGEALSREDRDAILQGLIPVSESMNQLPIHDLARQSVNEPIPGGAPTRVRAGRPHAMVPIPPTPSSEPASHSVAWGAAGILGTAGLAAVIAMRNRKPRARR